MLKKVILLCSTLLMLSTFAYGAGDAPKADSIHIPEAPYFTSLDSAMTANHDGRNILVEFYADW